MNNLSQNIVNHRHVLHLTQEKLAEKAKISVNFLSKLERGASRTVSAETLQHLANALKISMEELLNGIDGEHSYTKGPYEISRRRDGKTSRKHFRIYRSSPGRPIAFCSGVP